MGWSVKSVKETRKLMTILLWKKEVNLEITLVVNGEDIITLCKGNKVLAVGKTFESQIEIKLAALRHKKNSCSFLITC